VNTLESPVAYDEAATVTMPIVTAAATAAQNDMILNDPRKRRGVGPVDRI
jgi:hypothetical protein